MEGADWEFAAVADGHAGADSSALAVELLEGDPALPDLMELPVSSALSVVRTHLLQLFMDADTSQLQGETSVLAVARKDRYLLWLSIGDCVAYAVHPELTELGQYALNQRSFYEWFGRVDSLQLEVPCFASGVHALRPGRTRIALVTDGVLDVCGDLIAEFAEGAARGAVQHTMQAVHDGNGLDSATIVAWDVVAGPSPMHSSG
ncbi:hypothetical protein GCM10009743_16320 [Kribbella swartbergensis]